MIGCAGSLVTGAEAFSNIVVNSTYIAVLPDKTKEVIDNAGKKTIEPLTSSDPAYLNYIKEFEEAESVYVGGIIGGLEEGTLTSEADYQVWIAGTINVTANQNKVGGLIGKGQLGSVVGKNRVDFITNNAKITVKGNAMVGGAVGYGPYVGSITLNNVTVNGVYAVGGVAGYADVSSVELNNATVTATGKALSEDEIYAYFSRYSEKVGETLTWQLYEDITPSGNGSVNQTYAFAGGGAGVTRKTSVSTKSFKIQNLNLNANGGFVGGGVGAELVKYGVKEPDKTYETISINASKITNSTIFASGNGVGGMFGYVAYADIYSTGSMDTSSVQISGLSYVGGIVGRANGDIMGKILVKGNESQKITGSSYVGGVVGYLNGGILKNKSRPGGGDDIEAHTSIVVANVTVLGDNSTGSYVGGIAGLVTGHINVERIQVLFTDSTYSISGNAYVGGIAGKLEGGFNTNYVGSADGLTLGQNNRSPEFDSENDSYNYHYPLIDGANGSAKTVDSATAGYIGGGVNIENGVASINGNSNVGGAFGYNDGITAINGNIENIIVNGGTKTGGVSGESKILYVRYLKLKTNKDENGLNISVVGSGDYTGGFVGYSNGLCAVGSYRGVRVSGTNYVGGICGYSNGGSITASARSLRINGNNTYDGITASGSYVGGICGYAIGGCKISGQTAGEDANNDITISGVNYVGGVLGKGDVRYVYDGDGNILREQCSSPTVSGENSATITASGSYVGGIAGELIHCTSDNTQQVKISGSNTGSISAQGDYVGGICGNFHKDTLASSSAKLGNCRVTVPARSSISGGSYVGGLFGYVDTDAGEKSESTELRVEGITEFVGSKEKVVSAIMGSMYVGGLAGYSAVGANLTDNHKIIVKQITMQISSSVESSSSLYTDYNDGYYEGRYKVTEIIHNYFCNNSKCTNYGKQLSLGTRDGKDAWVCNGKSQGEYCTYYTTAYLPKKVGDSGTFDMLGVLSPGFEAGKSRTVVTGQDFHNTLNAFNYIGKIIGNNLKLGYYDEDCGTYDHDQMIFSGEKPNRISHLERTVELIDSTGQVILSSKGQTDFNSPDVTATYKFTYMPGDGKSIKKSSNYQEIQLGIQGTQSVEAQISYQTASSWVETSREITYNQIFSHKEKVWHTVVDTIGYDEEGRPITSERIVESEQDIYKTDYSNGAGYITYRGTQVSENIKVGTLNVTGYVKLIPVVLCELEVSLSNGLSYTYEFISYIYESSEITATYNAEPEKIVQSVPNPSAGQSITIIDGTPIYGELVIKDAVKYDKRIEYARQTAINANQNVVVDYNINSMFSNVGLTQSSARKIIKNGETVTFKINFEKEEEQLKINSLNMHSNLLGLITSRTLKEGTVTHDELSYNVRAYTSSGKVLDDSVISKITSCDFGWSLAKTSGTVIPGKEQTNG